MYLVDSNTSYFSLLTAEEQLSDIREYYEAQKNYWNDKDQAQLIEMIQSGARTKEEIEENCVKVLYGAFPKDKVLSSFQKLELKYYHHTIITIPTKAFNDFEEWCKRKNLSYRLVAQHENETRDYVISEDTKKMPVDIGTIYTGLTWHLYKNEQPRLNSRVLILNKDGTIETVDYGYEDENFGNVFYGINNDGNLFPYDDLYWTYLPQSFTK